jgi:Icc-related predicted phosphoesterase
MKLLLFSDLHADTEAAKRLVALSEKVDVVVGAGDFANARSGISKGIEILRQIRVPTVLVPGNNESLKELLDACRSWAGVNVLHGCGIDICGRHFFGLGGGIPVTPFGSWSWDFSEEEGEALLANCPPGAVLISHSPPKGGVDVSSSGRSLGSTAVRNAVTRLTPRLVVCGHIHASAGQRAVIGTTPVINAGPDGIIYELGDV